MVTPDLSTGAVFHFGDRTIPGQKLGEPVLEVGLVVRIVSCLEERLDAVVLRFAGRARIGMPPPAGLRRRDRIVGRKPPP